MQYMFYGFYAIKCMNLIFRRTVLYESFLRSAEFSSFL